MARLAAVTQRVKTPATVVSRHLLAWAGLASAAFLLAGGARLAALSAFDAPLIRAVNTLARRSELLDFGLRTIDRFNAFQSVALMALVYFTFAAVDERRARVRLVIGCAAAAVAAAASRASQLLLPESPRPLFDPGLGFVSPWGQDTDPETLARLNDWSSFPSDHSALLFGLAVAILLVRPRVGWLALGIAALAGFARVYEGFHYPTDTVGGGLLGAAVVLAAGAVQVDAPPSLREILQRRRALVTGAAFFVSVQAAYLFDDVRMIVAGLVKHLF